MFNPFSPSELSKPNFSLNNTYKIRHLVMRKWNWSNKANYWRLKVIFSQICSMKSMDISWENLTIQLGLKELRAFRGLQTFFKQEFSRAWCISKDFSMHVQFLCNIVEPIHGRRIRERTTFCVFPFGKLYCVKNWMRDLKVTRMHEQRISTCYKIFSANRFENYLLLSP